MFKAAHLVTIGRQCWATVSNPPWRIIPPLSPPRAQSMKVRAQEKGVIMKKCVKKLGIIMNSFNNPPIEPATRPVHEGEGPGRGCTVEGSKPK